MQNHVIIEEYHSANWGTKRKAQVARSRRKKELEEYNLAIYFGQDVGLNPDYVSYVLIAVEVADIKPLTPENWEDRDEED